MNIKSITNKFFHENKKSMKDLAEFDRQEKGKCCENCEEPDEELLEGTDKMITNGYMICGNKKCTCHSPAPQEKEAECPLRAHPYGMGDEIPLCNYERCTHILLPSEFNCPCHQ